MSQQTRAQLQFEIENNIEISDAATDAMYVYDKDEQSQINEAQPWKTEYVVTHARAGGSIEVMGLMQGKIKGDTFIIMDAFPLPVEGTETRVNAAAEAYEYMGDYLETVQKINKPENVVGWWHSHPGYGCWLSGIDVNTQFQNQQFQDPWLALVIDPNRTISAGKVDIGAFRTYPKDYKPPGAPDSEYQTIPLDKIEDFGVHANEYYSLEVSFFKSLLDCHILDILWNKYWVSTLSQSPLLTNREYSSKQMYDLGLKLNQVYLREQNGDGMKVEDKNKKSLEKIVKDSEVVTSEQAHGLMAQYFKRQLFSFRLQQGDNTGQMEVKEDTLYQTPQD